MTQSLRTEAEATLAAAEAVTAVLLPEPVSEIVPLTAAPAPKAEAIRQKMTEIDLTNTQSIIAFGSGAQSELQVISQAMLADVRNKDVGPAGDSLRKMVSTLRGFSSEELDVLREKSWWEWLTGQAAPFAEFVAKFENVQTQIDKITGELLSHEHKLLKDIKSLGRRAVSFQASVDAFDECARMAEAVKASLGPVSILVNNAGIASRGQTVADTDPGEMSRVLGVHALAPFYMSKLLLPQMRSQPRGDIIMISSVATMGMSARGGPCPAVASATRACAVCWRIWGPACSASA
jgi:hypothetical protein